MTALIDMSTWVYIDDCILRRELRSYLIINSPMHQPSLQTGKMVHCCFDIDSSPAALAQHRHNAAAASRVC